MNKLNMIKSFLVAGMLTVNAGLATGQVTEPGSDSILRYKVPANLFGSTLINNTAAVSTITGDQLYRTPAANITNALPGLLPGLTVIQGTGQPGEDEASWLIRGVGSYGFGGYNVAKVFVDGFEVNANYMMTLSASEIETFSILKDGAAVVTFGDRGANGVIWIETKRGKEGPATVSANFRSGLQMPTKITKPLGSYDFANLYNQAISNDKGSWTPTYSQTQLDAYRNGTGIDVDWYDEVMRDNGYFVDGDVIFQGGNATARYNVVLGYMHQEGLFDVKNDRDRSSNLRNTRYNVRANLDFNMFQIFEAKVDLGGKIQDQKRPNYGIDDLMTDLATYPSNIYNVHATGATGDRTGLSGTSVYPNNPYGSVRELGYRLRHSRTLQGNFTLKEKLDFVTPGLYLQESFSFVTYTQSGYGKTKDYARYMGDNTTTTNIDESITAGGWGSDGMEDWKQGKITLGWDRSYGKHMITSAANFHISAYNGDGLFSYQYHYMNYNGRINYNYDNRYVAEFGFSAFGNDAYEKDQRWSFYPAVSAAWVVSNEQFLNYSSIVNLLKIRASFGMAGASDTDALGSWGNDRGFSSNGRYLYKRYFAGMNMGSFYKGTSTGSSGTLRPLFLSNMDAHAERSKKYNIGIDMKLADRFTFTIDGYLDKRTDILTLEGDVMGYYGQNWRFANLGKMTNKGFEASAMYAERRGEWSYNINAMVSFNRNKIDEMGEVSSKNNFSNLTGRPFGTYVGLIADGFYTDDDFDSNGNLKSDRATPAFGNVQPGDLKYKDLDDNGIIDEDDITKIGKSMYPEWTYSFGGSVAYKGFDLSILFQGVAGASMNLLDTPIGVAFVDNGNAYPIAKDAWVNYPSQGLVNTTNAKYPRLTTQENTNNYRASSFWIKDNNYLKVRNIELGYTFHGPRMESSGIHNLRLYFNAVNPFIFSKIMKDYDIDPEVLNYMSGTSNSYPAIRSFNFGVSLTF